MPKPKREGSRLPQALAEWALASRVGYLAAAYTGSRWLTKATAGRDSTGAHLARAHLRHASEPAVIRHHAEA